MGQYLCCQKRGNRMLHRDVCIAIQCSHIVRISEKPLNYDCNYVPRYKRTLKEYKEKRK